MEGNRRLLGWLALGLGALALLVALVGRGFSFHMMVSLGDAPAAQAYAQQRAVPSLDALPPGVGAEPGAGRAPHPRLRGPAAPADMARRGEGWPGHAGFGAGGMFGLPFAIFGDLLRLGLLALLVALGVWLIRGRRPSVAAQGPAPVQRSPTGESYVDDSGADEQRGQS